MEFLSRYFERMCYPESSLHAVLFVLVTLLQPGYGVWVTPSRATEILKTYPDALQYRMRYGSVQILDPNVFDVFFPCNFYGKPDYSRTKYRPQGQGRLICFCSEWLSSGRPSNSRHNFTRFVIMNTSSRECWANESKLDDDAVQFDIPQSLLANLPNQP